MCLQRGTDTVVLQDRQRRKCQLNCQLGWKWEELGRMARHVSQQWWGQPKEPDSVDVISERQRLDEGIFLQNPLEQLKCSQGTFAPNPLSLGYTEGQEFRPDSVAFPPTDAVWQITETSASLTGMFHMNCVCATEENSVVNGLSDTFPARFHFLETEKTLDQFSCAA